MILSSICRHNKFTIANGKPTGNCKICSRQKNESFYTPNLSPFFNRGLGMVTYGTRDAEKKAKRMGLIPVGDQNVDKIIKKQTFDPTPILEEGLMKLKGR